MIFSTALIKAVKEFKLSHGGIHGISHWNEVHRNGVAICQHTPKADQVVVEHFAILHDMARKNEGVDILHGPAAAYMIEDMELDISDAQRMLLVFAVRHHSDGKIAKSPTIGACWDADRLDLVRLGMEIDLSMMSTEHGKVMAAEANRKLRHSDRRGVTA